ncbi:TOBE domain-containing protein, partial [Clostridium sp. UBA1652]|uniref:TOBE domain-containing protein n=1 Tax=Clostridium sp. UBA1652 TaxID=1946348 RepID=UPI002579B8F0
THDQEEALTMSDRIAIMNGGILEQVGTPDEIYERPVSKFVADFIGESNIFSGTIRANNGDYLKIDVDEGQVVSYAKGFMEDEHVYVSVRPEKINMSMQSIEGFSLVGIVKEHVYVGSMIKSIVVLSSGEEIKINRLTGEDLIPIGKKVYIHWNVKDAVVMHSKDNEEKFIGEESGLDFIENKRTISV